MTVIAFKRITILNLALTVAFVVSAALSEAADLDVCPSGCTYSSIQAAIGAAVNEDTVIVSNGTYNENIDFLGKKITVKSVNGAATTIIDGNANDSVVVFENSETTSSVLSGFTIRNGQANDGGGIFCNNSSSPTIVNCIINNNTSNNNGGGIYCTSSSSPTIINCTITSNKANGEGGGIWGTDTPSLTLVNSIVWSNTATNYNEIRGLGVTATYSDIKQDPGTTYTGDNNINSNPLFVDGGDYHLQAASPCIDTGTDDSLIYSNLPTIDMDGESRPLGSTYDMGADEQCLDADNDGYYSGGNGCTPVDCNDSVFSINPGVTEACGDGVDNNCDLSIDEGCDFDGDGLPDDWEYEHFGNLDENPNDDFDQDGYTNLQEYERGCNPKIAAVTHNVPGIYTTLQSAINASACGDTILVAPGTYTENIIFSGQVVTVIASGPDTIIDGGGADSVVRFESGENEYTVLSGFVIRNGGNTLYGYGGGIDIFDSSPTIINNVIVNNDADAGGGISCDSSSSIIMNNTITDNTALDGGGIFCSNTNSPYVANTILWDNAGGEIYLDNASITVEYSNIEGSYAGTGNINSDPLFVDEAGADYHLQSGSPCIDSGTATNAPLNDIDGNARPQGAGIDMGADEYVGSEDNAGKDDGDHKEGASGSGCFIATVVYGTPMAYEVRILCSFRDTYLLPNSLGQKLVSLYYKYSPPVADYIRDNPYLKATVRGMLKPVIWVIEKINK